MHEVVLEHTPSRFVHTPRRFGAYTKLFFAYTKSFRSIHQVVFCIGSRRAQLATLRGENIPSGLPACRETTARVRHKDFVSAAKGTSCMRAKGSASAWLCVVGTSEPYVTSE